MYPTQNQPPKPPQTLGDMQTHYAFRMSQFINGDQITIVEDLPKNKPVRENRKKSQKGNDYTVYLIRINANGFEADLEMFAVELNNLAIACPKGTDNFKGIVLVHNGRTFTYLMGNMPTPQAAIIPDRRQPDLYASPAPVEAPVDQSKAFIVKMVNGMEYMKKVYSPEYRITTKVLMTIAESITPGKALELIANAKAQGYITESDGVYKPT
jgi:hypothetical protein